MALREFLVGAKSNDLWGFFFAQICCQWPLYPATSGQAIPVARGRRTAALTTKTFADLPLTSQFFDFIDLSMKYAAPKSLETGFLDQVNAFAGEKVAMTAQGTWCESQILQINPDIEMGFLPVPVLEDASKSKLMVGPFWEYCIAKDGQNIEASKAFLNWLITSEYGQKFFSENLKLATAVVGTEFPKTQLAEDAQKYIAQDATVTTVQLLWPDGYEQKQGDAFQKYIAGKITREQCLAEMTEQWQKFAK